MSLPPEILTEIFSYLENPGQLSSCILVCTVWCNIASPILWRSPKPSAHAVVSLTRTLLSLQRKQSESIRLGIVDKVRSNKEIFPSLGPYFTCSYNLFIEKLDFSTQTTTQLHIQDSFIQAIALNCPNIKKVDLTNCYKLTDVAVKALSSRCKNIQYFTIAGCILISDIAISTLTGFPQLKSLSVKHCFIDGDTLASVVQGCFRLTSLDLSHCQNISRQALESIFDTGREFESLQLNYCGVTHSVVQKIALYSDKLRHINLNNVYILTDSTIINLAFHSPVLAYLSVASSSISESGILALAQNCRKLRSVDLSYCKAVTNRSVVALAKHCADIEHFSMGHCDKVSDVSIIAIASSLPHIRSVDVTCCGQISNSSIKALLNNCCKLESLKIGYCVHVTREVIQDISNKLVNLHCLDISGMQDLRDDDIRILMRKLPRLKSLRVKGCSNVSDEFWEEMTSGCY